MTNSVIVSMVVKACGISVKEAEELVEVENVQAERLYVDCAYEEQRDAEEQAYWDEVEREEREYYERNIAPFRAWAKEHIWDKKSYEILAEDWDFYSDWHKDLYGFRPHGEIEWKREEEARAEAQKEREAFNSLFTEGFEEAEEEDFYSTWFTM